MDRKIKDVENAIEVKMNEFSAGSRIKANGLLKPKDRMVLPNFVKTLVGCCRHPGLARNFSFAALGELQAYRISEVFSQNPEVYESILLDFF
jgi:hypothetical protein